MSARSAASRGVLPLAAPRCLGGCGVGAGRRPDAPVAPDRRRATSARPTLVDTADAKVAGADTVMRVLQRNAKVTTRFGGQFVQSIDGVRGGRRDGRPVDWFIYVNGILTDQGAGAIDVHGGDRIWWDHHDWGVTPDVRAVVGSFPEPFVHGSERQAPAGARRVRRPAARGLRRASPKKLHRARRSRSGAAPSAAAPPTSRCAMLVGPWKRAARRRRRGRRDRRRPEGQRRLRALRRRRRRSSRARRARPRRADARRRQRARSRRRAPTSASRCGSSPAPTTPASRAPRGRSTRARSATASRSRSSDDLPVAVPAKAGRRDVLRAPREPAARRARAGRGGLRVRARHRGAGVREPARAGRARRRDRRRRRARRRGPDAAARARCTRCRSRC